MRRFFQPEIGVPRNHHSIDITDSLQLECRTPPRGSWKVLTELLQARPLGAPCGTPDHLASALAPDSGGSAPLPRLVAWHLAAFMYHLAPLLGSRPMSLAPVTQSPMTMQPQRIITSNYPLQMPVNWLHSMYCSDPWYSGGVPGYGPGLCDVGIKIDE
jgi:hypothetical protein